MFFDDNNILRLGRLIARGGPGGMTELEFFAREIRLWKASRARIAQMHGEAYYRGRHDILRRKRTVIGADGEPTEVKNIPNNRIVDNQYALMVDQKVNYLVGKPFTVKCDNKQYRQALEKVFSSGFRRTIKYVAEDALNCGICWVYPYYNKRNELVFRRFPAYEINPYWADDEHTELDCAVRLYRQEVYEGRERKQIERVEIFKKDGLWRYVFDDDGELIPDVELGEHENYLGVDTDDGRKEYNWERIPLIAFRTNKQELPLLTRVKSLQDGINAILSDFQNNMQEDARNTILVITNYDGENLGELRQNLAAYGAVKVRDDGGVTTLHIEVNSQNYKVILDMFKKALIENARGYNAKDDRMSGNPNQMNIQSMYSDIDLDANGMETEFQAAFGELLFFINAHLANSGQGSYEDKVEIVFNRDILINESEAIKNCSDSAGILSEETIIEQHPWVTDASAELKRIKKERERTREDYPAAFGAKKPQKGRDSEEGSGDE